jgi:hypothetical protein
MLLSVREPGEDEQTRTLQFMILSFHAEELPANADTPNDPLAAKPKVGLHVCYLESTFRAPPLALKHSRNRFASIKPFDT